MKEIGGRQTISLAFDLANPSLFSCFIFLGVHSSVGEKNQETLDSRKTFGPRRTREWDYPIHSLSTFKLIGPITDGGSRRERERKFMRERG